MAVKVDYCALLYKSRLSSAIASQSAAEQEGQYLDKGLSCSGPCGFHRPCHRSLQDRRSRSHPAGCSMKPCSDRGSVHRGLGETDSPPSNETGSLS